VTTIYGLVDPAVPWQIRYVGKTMRNPGLRLRDHVRESRVYPSWPKSRWIRMLLDGGREPEVIVLESVIDDQWPIAERQWIAGLKQSGLLVNVKPGGEFEPLSREKIRERLLAIRRAPAYRSKMAETTRRTWDSREHHHSSETKAKIREILARPEVHAALVQSHLGHVAWNKGIKTGPMSPLQRASHAAAMARTETREKLRVSHLGIGKGVPKSPETRARMSASARRLNAR
jgi:hypothetical protein